jgi:protein-disulfide isomerase
VVDYSFRQFPLESIHKAAFKAGEASACAGEQGKFWEMHERLFQNQQQLDPASLLSYASSLGVDAPRFQTCLAGQMVQRIRDDEDEAKRLGVNSTPTFLVGLLKQNGKVQVLRKIAGAVPYETFKSVVDEVLKGA